MTGAPKYRCDLSQGTGAHSRMGGSIRLLVRIVPARPSLPERRASVSPMLRNVAK